MYPFTLVTDSTIDETASYFSQNAIKCVPLAFTIDNRTIEEDCGQTVSFHQFYDLLRQGKQSSTSQAKLDTFLTIFHEALDAGQDVLYIGFRPACPEHSMLDVWHATSWFHSTRIEKFSV